jgi:hypothetical protein
MRVLFNFFVGNRAEPIEEYCSGSFVSPGGFGRRGLKFCLDHLKRIWRVVYRMPPRRFKHEQHGDFYQASPTLPSPAYCTAATP